jgi:quercetin dioxygenase-like cupin family protein
MRRLIIQAALLALAGTGHALAEEVAEPSPVMEPPSAARSEEPFSGLAPVLPDTLKWAGPPNIPALKVAWMLGSEKDAGPYVLRVKLADGGRIGAHTHPEDRVTSVLSGTLYVGFGTVFDETRVQAVPAGAVYLTPADQPHYVWAKDGDVEYQENGFGPTDTNFNPR